MAEPRLAEVTISHSAGGSVDIRDYGKEKSTYGVFESAKWVFPDDWTPDEVDEFREKKYAVLRERVDAQAQREHDERFEQSYLSGH